ncbi:MAG: hypothetical protein KDA89_07595 [Planctomycetaceae bacterium]|nr:hypothetical protein [Planctomycetaceae bacterium]
MLSTDIRVLEAEPHFSWEAARTPLKFGGVVMDTALYCHVRVLVENRRGDRAEGWGAIFLADLWAWPHIRGGHKTAEALMRELAIEWCSRAALTDEFLHPVDLFHHREPQLMPAAADVCRSAGVEETMPRMAALISISPFDAAVHDAFGNVNRICTYAGYGPEFMSSDLSAWLGPTFAGRFIADYLQPLKPRVDAFHLVGGLDPLTAADLSTSRPPDNLPVTLEEWIEFERLHCLKVKLQGTDIDWDLHRLCEVVDITQQQHARLNIPEMWFTADPNEMCESPEYVVELLLRFWERCPRGYESLLYVEQPCERDLNRRRLDMRPIAELKPVIVDEALGSMEDLQLALELGYSGAALKSCKCQSEQLVMAAWLTEHGLPLAVQDLGNPGIALLHSAGLAGRLNTIRGVESNSRQFYPATNEPEQKVHPGAYRLTDGCIATDTLRGTGLGYRWDEIGRILS